MHALTHIHRSRDAHTSRCARTHNQWSRDVHKQTRTHTYARTQAHAHAHICKDTSTRARIAHSQWSRDAHAHAHALTFIGHVMRKQTTSKPPPLGHVMRTHTYARTQANDQEHELTILGHQMHTSTRARTASRMRTQWSRILLLLLLTSLKNKENKGFVLVRGGFCSGNFVPGFLSGRFCDFCSCPVYHNTSVTTRFIVSLRPSLLPGLGWERFSVVTLKGRYINFIDRYNKKLNFTFNFRFHMYERKFSPPVTNCHTFSHTFSIPLPSSVT